MDRRQFLMLMGGTSQGTRPSFGVGADSLTNQAVALPALEGVIRNNRLYLPRELLPASTNVIITAGTQRQLLMLSIENWALMRSKILALPGSAAIKRVVVGNARTEPVDQDGSILLAEELMEFAKLKRNVNLIRQKKGIEIWAA